MLNTEKTAYGKIELRIVDLLKERHISKNQLCKDLDIPRYNFNRYCRNDFQRIDTVLLCKLCWYLGVKVDELVVYKSPENIASE